jgi:hypothetical protein
VREKPPGLVAKLRAHSPRRKAVARRCAVERIAQSAAAAISAPLIAAGSSTAAWVRDRLLALRLSRSWARPYTRDRRDGQDNHGSPPDQHHFPAPGQAPARSRSGNGRELSGLIREEPSRSVPTAKGVGPPNAHVQLQGAFPCSVRDTCWSIPDAWRTTQRLVAPVGCNM